MSQEEGMTVDEYRRLKPRAFDRTRRSGRPAYVRRERRPGWSAPLPVYALWCDDCGRFTVTHPAGYGRIHCAGCRRHEKVMTWQRLRDKEIAVPLAYVLAVIFTIIGAYLAS